MPHLYPNGTNYPLVAANMFWNFFKQYTLPLTSIESISPPKSISLYPNPAHDYLIVAGEGEMTLTLRNVLGQELFSTQTQDGHRIRLPLLLRGIYLAEIFSENKHSIVKLSIR